MMQERLPEATQKRMEKQQELGRKQRRKSSQEQAKKKCEENSREQGKKVCKKSSKELAESMKKCSKEHGGRICKKRSNEISKKVCKKRVGYKVTFHQRRKYTSKVARYLAGKHPNFVVSNQARSFAKVGMNQTKRYTRRAAWIYAKNFCLCVVHTTQTQN